MRTDGSRTVGIRWGLLCGALVAALAATWTGQAGVAAQTAARQVILDERFTDNARNWPIDVQASTGQRGKNFFNGDGFNIQIPDAPTHFAWYLGSNPPVIAGDTYAEAELKVVDGPLTAAYGISVLVKEARGPGYMLLIRGDRRYSLIREGSSGDTTLIPWTASEALKPGRESNTIALAAARGLLAVYLNGQQVARVLDRTITGSGGVFLRVQNTLTVAARRLTVGVATADDFVDKGGGEIREFTTSAQPTPRPAATAVPAPPAQPAQPAPAAETCARPELMTGSGAVWNVLPGLYGLHPTGEVQMVFSGEEFATPCWGEGLSPVWMVDVLLPEDQTLATYAVSGDTILTGAAVGVRPRGEVTERSITPLFALAEAPPEILDSGGAWAGVQSVNANDALRRMGAQLKSVMLSRSPADGLRWQYVFEVPAANARLLVVVNPLDPSDTYVVAG